MTKSNEDLVKNNIQDYDQELNLYYRLICDSISDHVAMYDRDGNTLYINGIPALRFGKSGEELIEDKISTSLNNEYSDLYSVRLEKIREAFDTGKTVTLEDSRDGLWFSNSFYPVFDEGQVKAVTLISKDITDLKNSSQTAIKNAELRREAEILREKEQEYLEIIDGSSEASWIYDIKTDKLMFSAEWKKLIGGSEISDERMNAYHKSTIHPDDFLTVMDRRQLTYKLKLSKYNCEYRLKTSSGKYIWVQDKGKIIYDPQGMPIKVYGTSADITDRKVAENELRELKDDLAAEVDALSTLHRLRIFQINRELKDIYKEVLEAAISLTNAQKGLLQLYNEESKTLQLVLSHGFGINFTSHFSCIDFESSFGKNYLEKKTIIFEDVPHDPCLTWRPGFKYLMEEGVISSQTTPLISSTGKFVGVLNTYYTESKRFKDRECRMLDMLSMLAADAIERTKIQNALKQSELHALHLVEILKKEDKNKNEFLSILSHELRNPLASIVAGLSVLNMTSDYSQIEKSKKLIKRQTDHLCRLVDDLLDITRINNGKIRLKKEIINLNALINQTCRDCMHIFEEKHIFFHEDICGIPLSISADPVRITQIVGNLLQNASRYTEADGEVVLSLRREGSCAVINVTDNGIGISPEILPDVFNAFTQADSSLDRPDSGLGLGLAIVKGIAELHGGTVRARSEGLGLGSSLTILLPISRN